MNDLATNKFRAAVEVLQRGRDVLVDELADEILEQADDLIDGSYAFNELLETQGTRLHFLALLLSQLEQSAEIMDEALAARPPAPRKRRSRSKKVQQQATAEEKTSEDTH
ncbi:hypothetical protein EP7_001468 [Isosphaeraceae bacterium EP7]